MGCSESSSVGAPRIQSCPRPFPNRWHLRHPFFHVAGYRAQDITQNHHRLRNNRLFGYPGKLSMTIPLQRSVISGQFGTVCSRKRNLRKSLSRIEKKWIRCIGKIVPGTIRYDSSLSLCSRECPSRGNRTCRDGCQRASRATWRSAAQQQSVNRRGVWMPIGALTY